ncbi:MAG TPA: hypothetical protein VD907_03750 [Verrucomicrobiae bacterium]|nr:hypothetical protein [Verrucomicrobiae bacterium]
MPSPENLSFPHYRKSDSAPSLEQSKEKNRNWAHAQKILALTNKHPMSLAQRRVDILTNLLRQAQNPLLKKLTIAPNYSNTSSLMARTDFYHRYETKDGTDAWLLTWGRVSSGAAMPGELLRLIAVSEEKAVQQEVLGGYYVYSHERTKRIIPFRVDEPNGSRPILQLVEGEEAAGVFDQLEQAAQLPLDTPATRQPAYDVKGRYARWLPQVSAHADEKYL